MCELDEQDKRIEKALGKYDMEVDEKATLKYMDYLKSNIEFPCTLTGIEDFSWEEYYVLGPGSKKKYEQLKKTRASYTDTFDLLKFEDGLNEFNGVLVNVKRLSDGKIFILSLSDLEEKNKNSKNYELLNDYVVWQVNN